MSEKLEVRLTVNGVPYQGEVEPRYLLADFLRHELGLTGTHIGCEHGVCGACTVLINGQSARSCLHFAAALEGAEITTVESLASSDELHPIQQAFQRNYALQCGFCTPGVLITTVELLSREPDPSREFVREALTNNVCRCTGYGAIVDAVIDAGRCLREKSAASGAGE